MKTALKCNTGEETACPTDTNTVFMKFNTENLFDIY